MYTSQTARILKYRLLALTLSWLLGLGTAYAQAPDWTTASAGGTVQANGYTVNTATAIDAAGNVLVGGYFVGQVAFGNTVLLSAGKSDLFVAKWLPATNTWAWAQRSGGTESDRISDLVVSGSSIYVAGAFSNTRDNRYDVKLGGQPQAGTGTTGNVDWFVARLTDPGPGPTWQWVQAGGGSTDDALYGVAVQGSSVYVAGYVYNSSTNTSPTLLGGSGLTAGTMPVYGATPTPSPDLLLVKYQDNGSSAVPIWTQVAGGTSDDQARAIAVSGTAVYVTGFISNNSLNDQAVVFGGSGSVVGTAAQAGVAYPSSQDMVLARWTDNGNSASFNWSQVAGSTNVDQGTGVAAAGGSVYLLGSGYAAANRDQALVLGGSGLTPGRVVQYGVGTAKQALLLAKYQDQGTSASVAWTQVAGGKGGMSGTHLRQSGSTLYVLGTALNDQANGSEVLFGGSGTTPGTHSQAGATTQASQDLVLARYTDQGSRATVDWTQIAGGTGFDTAGGLGLSSSGLAVGMTAGVSPAIRFDGATNSLLFGGATGRTAVGWLQDQGTAGAWQTVGAALAGSDMQVLDVATDAQGSVFVTGYFTGEIWVGSTLLTSLDGTDIFIAKYVPATDTWPWAVRAGGTGHDYGYGVAVQGSSIYVTGVLVGDLANSTDARLGALPPAVGTPLPGATATPSQDMLLLKLLDQGSSVAFGWAQAAGGTGYDLGRAVAVQGSSVYVAGSLTNTLDNAAGVVFGGNQPQYGASTTTSQDMLLAKWTDNGSSATFAWSQVAGGIGNDQANSVAVNGTRVYVTGQLYNDLANRTQVVFGGGGQVVGTRPQYGAGSNGDLVLACYTDQGTTGAFNWSQVGGGIGPDWGEAVAVQGSNIYVAGNLLNNTSNQALAVLGGSGTTAGTLTQLGATSTVSYDQLLLKYTDQGSQGTLVWSQVAGGTNNDSGYGVAVQDRAVYMVGNFANDQANSKKVVLGGSGSTLGNVPLPGLATTFSDDVAVTRYDDQGPQATLAWARLGGGSGNDFALAAAASPTHLYVAGTVGRAGTFGSRTINLPGGAPSYFVADLGANTLPTHAASPGVALALYPNPAPGSAVFLNGAAPRATVQVLDVLGRVAATATTTTTGTATLAGLPPGLYLVRVGSECVRLSVE